MPERRQAQNIVGKIVEVDADVAQLVVTADNVLDLQESETVLPGMIDLHAHYNLDLVDKGRVEEVVHNGTIFLANGVTSTWSAGAYDDACASLHNLSLIACIANGECPVVGSGTGRIGHTRRVVVAGVL